VLVVVLLAGLRIVTPSAIQEARAAVEPVPGLGTTAPPGATIR
jgi:hypothetical protein